MVYAEAVLSLFPLNWEVWGGSLRNRILVQTGRRPEVLSPQSQTCFDSTDYADLCVLITEKDLPGSTAAQILSKIDRIFDQKIVAKRRENNAC